jgi:glucokinase
VPGPIDFEARGVVSPPNLPGWGVVPVAPLLEDLLGVHVEVENDANAAALGEATFGAGRGARIVLALTLGTGVGGGIVIDGRVHRGATGVGGEIGHIVIRRNGKRCGCGARGCLEQYASASAMLARAKAARRRHPESTLAAIPARDLTGRDVTSAARAGDAVALRVLEDTGRDLGEGIVSAVNLIDPDVVVIAGGLTAASRFLLPAARRTVKEKAFGRAKDVRIVKHRLGDRAGILGAALSSKRRI